MTKRQAEQAGRKLLKRMRGTGWKLHVHENFGWHYSVQTEHLQVSGPSIRAGEKAYSCLLIPHYTFFGNPAYNVDPNKAVVETLKTAVANFAKIRDIVRGALRSML